MLPIIWALWKCSHKMLEKVWQFENCYGAWSFRADYIGWIKKGHLCYKKKVGTCKIVMIKKKNSGSLRILRLPSKIMKVEIFQWCPNKYFEAFWKNPDVWNLLAFWWLLCRLMISRTFERLKKNFTSAQTFWASEKILALLKKTFLAGWEFVCCLISLGSL